LCTPLPYRTHTLPHISDICLYLTAVCVSIEPPIGRELISLNAEQAYAPTIPSAYRLQRAGSTFTNAAVRGCLRSPR
jgi:hypothetical protein